MDPITHAVIGMTIFKITGNEVALSNPSVIGVVVGAMLPDIDIVLQKWGDYLYLKHHRGVTHSILGLVISAFLFSGVLRLVFPVTNNFELFVWTFIGTVSHTLVDILNPYGAKILWPFSNKKFSLNLITIFDPVLFLLLITYVVSASNIQGVFLILAVLYIAFRVVMRFKVHKYLKKKFREAVNKISLFPSMTGLFKWHFVLVDQSKTVVGEKSVLKKGIEIKEVLDKIESTNIEKVLFTPIGKFFSEFTPLFHVACERINGISRYVLTDMRYYVNNKFLHHAVLEIDDNDFVVNSSFRPYSINRRENGGKICEIKNIVMRYSKRLHLFYYNMRKRPT